MMQTKKPSDGPSPLVVPTVTEADLNQFHQQHFPNLPAPEKFWRNANETWEDEDEFEDDGLGHYPDGVKRTLTDEQIAIFRHSEVQELIKQSLRSQAEKQLSSGQMNDIPSTDLEALERKSKTVTKPKSSGLTKAERSSKRRADFRRLKKLKRSDGGGMTNIKEDEERFDPFDYMPENEQQTFRRKAREADEQKAEHVNLDY